MSKISFVLLFGRIDFQISFKHLEQELLTLPEDLSSPPSFQWGSCYSIFSFMCMFCRSLFVLLCVFIWPLYCLFFFDIRILITPLLSSNSSFDIFSIFPFITIKLTIHWLQNTGHGTSKKVNNIFTPFPFNVYLLFSFPILCFDKAL